MHTEKYGVTDRVSFSRNKNVLGLPNLIGIQTDSFDWFVKKGIKEVFEDISPIKDYAGSLVLEFVDYYFEENPKYTIQEAKDRDTNYSCPLKVKVRLINTDTEEVKEQEVFMGDFPLMTDSGTFIINGAERVIVSQLVRSPGVYFAEEIDKSGNSNFASTVIPNRGAWLEMDTDASGVVNIRIDRTRKLPVTTLLRALLFDTDDEIIEAMGDSEILRKTLEKEISKDRESALIEIYKKLKPGDPASLESAEPLINNMFFDSRRYDLAKVGRYKFNKKLSLRDRITNQKAKEDVVDTSTGEILATAGDLITEEMAIEIENAGINVVDVIGHEGQSVRVIGNHFVDLDSFGLDMDLSDLNLSEKVYYPIMEKILEENDDEKSIRRAIEENVHQLSPIHIIHS
ncbi:MAG: DNA-directed RNA polymerase subunit beta, partial [Finegoldia magna]|nr:DNA-directed RNA polymerase subunit beta [Finegoldia magna]